MGQGSKMPTNIGSQLINNKNSAHAYWVDDGESCDVDNVTQNAFRIVTSKAK